MSSPASQLPEHSEQSPGTLRLVSPPEGQERPFFNPDLFLTDIVDELADEYGLNVTWPMIETTTTEGGMLGSELAEATTDSRIRHGVLMLQMEEHAWKQQLDMPDDEPLFLLRPQGETANTSVKQMAEFLNRRAKLGKGNGQPPRDMFLPLHKVVAELRGRWQKIGYPVEQLLTQTAADYGSRLKEHEISDFTLGLIVASQKTLIVSIYLNYERQFARLTKSSKEIVRIANA